MAQLHVDRSVGVEYRELTVQNNTTTVLDDGSAHNGLLLARQQLKSALYRKFS